MKKYSVGLGRFITDTEALDCYHEQITTIKHANRAEYISDFMRQMAVIHVSANKDLKADEVRELIGGTQ